MGTKVIWDGEQLPPIGCEVLIELSRPHSWVRHKVSGYDIGRQHQDEDYFYVVNVVLEASSDPLSSKNQRFLRDIRPLDWRPGEVLKNA